jgi:casein kinase II subunit beta
MHRGRGAAAAAGGAGDRKRIGEPMDRSSPSTSWGFSGGREKERIGAGNKPDVPRSGGGSIPMSMSKLSDGEPCVTTMISYVLRVTLFTL